LRRQVEVVYGTDEELKSVSNAREVEVRILTVNELVSVGLVTGICLPEKAGPTEGVICVKWKFVLQCSPDLKPVRVNKP